MKLNAVTLLLVSATMLAFNTARAETGSDAVENIEAAPVEAAPVEASSPSEEALTKFGEGMQIPVDGSSLEEFDKSLEHIKKKTTEAEYLTLTNALDYLLVYDLAAKRDRAKLAAHLDGLTGEQIVDRVEWRKPTKHQ